MSCYDFILAEDIFEPVAFEERLPDGFMSRKAILLKS